MNNLKGKKKTNNIAEPVRKNAPREGTGVFAKVTSEFSRGPDAKCKACEENIEKRTQWAVKYVFFEKDHFKFKSVWHYHCQPSCLRQMPKEALVELQEKRWPQAEIRKAVEKLQSRKSFD